MKSPMPPDETGRLEALRRSDILDPELEVEFDDITRLASCVCGTPIALISLVDENRQWSTSGVGATAEETSPDIAFCGHGILQPDVFEVEDALTDERFATNPLVTGDSKIRFLRRLAPCDDRRPRARYALRAGSGSPCVKRGPKGVVAGFESSGGRAA